jgi:hypothetical protein
MISIQCGELRPVLSKLSSIVTHFVCFVVNVNFVACFIDHGGIMTAGTKDKNSPKI